jgi:hypothetical protein
MIVAANTFLGDAWRIGVTLIALLVLSLFWYYVVSRITPFPGTKGKEKREGPPPEEKYPMIQKVTVTCDVILFIWIVLEGVVVIPIMLTKYGLH